MVGCNLVLRECNRVLEAVHNAVAHNVVCAVVGVAGHNVDNVMMTVVIVVHAPDIVCVAVQQQAALV